MPSCPRCGRAASEEARFCFGCGARVLPADHVSRATQARKTVTVLFADVSGYTALGERLDPETLQQVMGRYFAEMRRVVALHGGTVEKLIGDALMAVFGVPVLHEDDALRAARAALEMHAALDVLNDELADRWDVRLRTHSGINSGEVVIGETADGEPLTLGDTVNVAQRLEDAAAPGEILVGPVTAQLLRGVAAMTPVPPLRLKGKAAPVEASRLDAIGPDERRTVGPIPDLVGRAGELDRLLGTFADVVAERQPAVVTIAGPAGIGKSRLARALQDEVAEDAVVVTGRCLPYGEGITYWPLREIVHGIAGRADEAAIVDAAGGGPDARMIAERLARVIGVSPGGVAPEEARWAARRLLEIRAAQRPLVVVLDDIHWAEPSLLDLVEHVATFATDVPLLLACLSRPELVDRRPDWAQLGGRSTLIDLGPLPDPDAAALLRRLLGGEEIDRGVAARLLATAEGNPFFLEQIAAVHGEPAGAGAATPASIHTLLAARIDALPGPERAVVECAAVEGRGFHRSAIAELVDEESREHLDASLEALTRRRLIRPGPPQLPGEEGYRFVHILVRDVAYELLPKATRSSLHERFAAWLDRHADAGYGELVGYHLEQAHRWHAELRPAAVAERLPLAKAAAGRLGAAGRAALERGDLPAGVNLLERTAALLPADDEGRAEVLPELGLALVQQGQLPQAESILIEAARRAAARGATLAEAHARTAEFFALVQVDPEAAAHELGDRFNALRRTFSAALDDLGLARLWRAQALVHWLAGHTAQAQAAWERGVRHALRAGDEQGRADALVWLTSAALVGPTSVPRAINRCETILDQLSADRRSQALALRPLACLHGMAGRFDIAADLFARSTAIHEELGVSMHAAVGHDESLVAMLAGDPASAEAVLAPGYEHLQRIGERALMSTTAGLLAHAVFEQGRDDEAWELAEVCREAAAPDDLSAQIVWRTAGARILARRGDLPEADRLSGEAVPLAAQTDWLFDQGDALMARGEVLHAMGRLDEATLVLHKATEAYARKGSTVAVERARAAAEAATAPRVSRAPTRMPRRSAGSRWNVR